MTTLGQRLRDTLSHAYEIDRELGGGGMSRVFVATDRSLRRKVVIKLLSPELTADVNRGRFRREIQVAAQLQHPHIVPLLSAGEHEDLLYFTMPFITGESLKTAVENNGPLPLADVVRILYHVAEALDYAHGEGVVHRDIKPANILRSGNYALVTDFGVAKALNAAMPSTAMTSTGMAIGTPAYMSPEQLAGDPNADHRIDIYALGLLAYELLNGKSPFAASTPQRVLAAVLTQEATPLIEVRPDVPRSLSEIVMSCLSKEPDGRPESAKALLAGLDMFSTASGEIRTMEHKVPRIKTPVTPQFPATTPQSPAISAIEPTPTGSTQAPFEPDRPPTKTRKSLVMGLALLLPVAAGAILLSQRSGNAPSRVTDQAAILEGDSASTSPLPIEVTTGTVPAAGAAPVATPAPSKLDSQALADSVKRAVKAARAEEAKRAAAMKDSVRRAQTSPIANARSAVAAMLVNPSASQTFSVGATHMGGVLGKKRKGDLQTQINALQPFLTRAGLTYEQFKSIMGESGNQIFDEFGRMVPDSLRRFAGGS